MLNKIILIIFTIIGFTNSDVKLLELPKESKNFGASVKDYYIADYKGNYTYIYENDDGSKQRQDGAYGEKRGYYTFKAPLPDGRTFTVCYYTKNGYHAKTTIIEVEDIESYCDMIIEQSGNIKFQQQTTSIKTLNVSEKLKNKQFKINSQIQESGSFDSATPFRIQTSQNFRKLTSKPVQFSNEFQAALTESFDNVNRKTITTTKIPFIIIEEDKLDLATTSTDLKFEIDERFSQQSQSNLNPNFITSLNATNSDLMPLCDGTDGNDSFNCKTGNQKKSKVEELIAEISKYGIKRPSNNTNVTEILPPSKLFLPPYIDDDMDLLSVELPPPNKEVKSTTEPVIVTKSDLSFPSKKVVIKKVTRKTTIKTTTEFPTSAQTTESSTTKRNFTLRKRIMKYTTKTSNNKRTTLSARHNLTSISSNKPTSTVRNRTTFTVPNKTTSPMRITSIKLTNKNRIKSKTSLLNKNDIHTNTNFNSSKIEHQTNKQKLIQENIPKPNLDLVPPFSSPSLDLFPPVDNLEQISSDNTKEIYSNIVSRSIRNISKSTIECKHGILRTDANGKHDYVSPKTLDQLEAIRNVIKIYGCRSTKSTNSNLNEKLDLVEIESVLKNCRLSIIEMDKNEKISDLDPETIAEIHAMRKLNTVFGCSKN